MKSSKSIETAFSWDFQINAAIILMLQNIKRATEVKVDRSNDDVEITFENNKKLMSHVIAVQKPYDFTNALPRLADGLRILNDYAKINNVEKLLYVTNSPNPFDISETIPKFSKPINLIPFSDLPNRCKQTIRDICLQNNYDFDTELFTICVIQFYGDDYDERYKVLLDYTRNFLDMLNAETIERSRMLTIWKNLFSKDFSKKNVVVTKKSMIWPIITILCEVKLMSFVDYDDNDITFILEDYKKLITSYSERFEFVSRVTSHFSEFHVEKPYRERVNKFVVENFMDYSDCFNVVSADKPILKAIIGLTVSNILKNDSIIKEISSFVKL
ncbi:MAG: hypothetical protein LBF22_04210 [Deltaproteobacteria bacterium]|jgi:hypothetical protein|nr:hypothetical protein [Deltaproteobacteria bacterium]